LLGFNLHHTTSYHPQANGAVERFHRTIKAAMMAHENNLAWTDHLPWALLGMRTSYKADLDTSAAELVYSQPLTVPGELMWDFPPQPVLVLIQQLRERVGDSRPDMGYKCSECPPHWANLHMFSSVWTNIGSPCNSPTRVRLKLLSTGLRPSRCRGEQR
jgi:hypothetical protein